MSLLLKDKKRKRMKWKTVGILLLCVLVILTGCHRKKTVEKPKKEVVEVEEEEIETVEDMDDETFERVRYKVQEELMVLDVSKLDETFMNGIKADISSSMSGNQAKESIGLVLDGYLEVWKKEVVIETLEFNMGAYSRTDFERMMESTTNLQIRDMVVAYVMEKLKQEGYRFNN